MLLHRRYCEIRRNPAWMRVVVALAAPKLTLSWTARSLAGVTSPLNSHSSTDCHYYALKTRHQFLLAVKADFA